MSIRLALVESEIDEATAEQVKAIQDSVQNVLTDNGIFPISLETLVDIKRPSQSYVIVRVPADACDLESINAVTEALLVSSVTYRINLVYEFVIG